MKRITALLLAMLLLVGCLAGCGGKEETKEIAPTQESVEEPMTESEPVSAFPVSVESPRRWMRLENMMNIFQTDYSDGNRMCHYMLPMEYEDCKELLLHYCEDYLEKTVGLTRDNFEEKLTDDGRSTCWVYYSYPDAENYPGYAHSFMVGCYETLIKGYVGFKVYGSSAFDMEMTEDAMPKGDLPMALQSPRVWLAEDVRMELHEQSAVETSTRYYYIVPLDVESCIELLDKYSEDYLQKEKGLTLSFIDDTHEQEDGGFASFYFYPGAEYYYSSPEKQESTCLFLGCNRRTDDTTWITWVHSSSFEEDLSVPMPEPEPEPEPVVEKTPLSLPDPGVFLGGLNRNEDMDAYGGHLVSYKFDLDEGRALAEEYRQLLESWGNLEYDWEEEPFSWQGRTYTSTYYRYVGDGSITPIETTDAVCDVKMSISYYGDRGYVFLTLYYPSEMYVIDPGVRASSFPVDFVRGGSSDEGDSSGGSSGSSGRENTRPETDCFKCGGDGDITCTRCNGAGGKEIYTSAPNYSGNTSGSKFGSTWDSCSKCIGTGEMTCTACGGSGVN